MPLLADTVSAILRLVRNHKELGGGLEGSWLGGMLNGQKGPTDKGRGRKYLRGGTRNILTLFGRNRGFFEIVLQKARNMR